MQPSQIAFSSGRLISWSCPPKAKVTRSNRVGRANNIRHISEFWLKPLLARVSSRGGFNADDRDDVPFGKEEAT
jgi:hypothetical protein